MNQMVMRTDAPKATMSTEDMKELSMRQGGVTRSYSGTSCVWVFG